MSDIAVDHCPHNDSIARIIFALYGWAAWKSQSHRLHEPALNLQNHNHKSQITIDDVANHNHNRNNDPINHISTFAKNPKDIISRMRIKWMNYGSQIANCDRVWPILARELAGTQLITFVDGPFHELAKNGQWQGWQLRRTFVLIFDLHLSKSFFLAFFTFA